MARKQGNYVVKYNNELNKVELGKLSIREAKLMAAVCAYVKNKGTRKVVIDFATVRAISGFTDRNNKRLFDELLAMSKKLMVLDYVHVDGRQAEGFNLFSGWKLNADEQRFSLNVTEEFEFVLNRFGGNFTRFETDEFKLIEGKYALPLYRLLKQFRSTGLYCVHVEDFRRLLNVPPSYKTGQLDAFVINPALDELSAYFEELAVRKIYKSGRGRGGQVVKSLEFTFKRQNDVDGKQTEHTIDDLKRMIADTELKILSTKKAMEKQDALGDYAKYEIHKKKHIYFTEKLEALKSNLEHFAPEQTELNLNVLVENLADGMRFK